MQLLLVKRHWNIKNDAAMNFTLIHSFCIPFVKSDLAKTRVGSDTEVWHR